MPWMVYHTNDGIRKKMARQIRVEQVDAETGEIVNLVALKPKTTHPFKKTGFVQMSQQALLELARNPVSGESRRVLDALCATLDFDNFIPVSQRDLAELIGMHQPHISRAMSELVERGIVIKGVRYGRTYTYRLSPEFGFKSKGTNYRKLVQDVSAFAKKGRDIAATL